MLQLKDAVVVVTGGGSGIGEALALEAGRRGAQVAVADIDINAARAVAGQLQAAGAVAEAFQADMSDAAAVEALAKAVDDRFGKVSLLFNNAGVFPQGPLEKTSVENFTWVFNVNVFGVFYAIKAFLPLLRREAAQGRLAWLVNTGSENSLCVRDNGVHSAYTTSKHALLGMTDCLRRDLEADGAGVGVSLLCPGPVATQLWNSFRARQDNYGGKREAPASVAQYWENNQSPADVARIAFAGLDAGEFMIITDPDIQPFTDRRAAEIEKAFEILKERI